MALLCAVAPVPIVDFGAHRPVRAPVGRERHRLVEERAAVILALLPPPRVSVRMLRPARAPFRGVWPVNFSAFLWAPGEGADHGKGWITYPG